MQTHLTWSPSGNVTFSTSGKTNWGQRSDSMVCVILKYCFRSLILELGHNLVPTINDLYHIKYNIPFSEPEMCERLMIVANDRAVYRFWDQGRRKGLVRGRYNHNLVRL